MSIMPKLGTSLGSPSVEIQRIKDTILLLSQHINDLNYKVLKLQEHEKYHNNCIDHYKAESLRLADALVHILKRHESEESIEEAKTLLVNVLTNRISEQETHHGTG